MSDCYAEAAHASGMRTRTTIEDYTVAAKRRRSAPLPAPRRPSPASRRLDLRARQVVEGFISGMHQSPFFGHSVEFVQHREYTAGDDIRHLDWKVWSKTDKLLHQAVRGRDQPALPPGGRRQRVDALRPRAAEQVRLRLHRRRLPGLHAAAPAGRRRPASPSTTDVRQIVPARSQHDAHRRHRQGHGRQPAARQDRHREDPAPRGREHPAARHGRHHLRFARRPRAAVHAAWRCCATAGTTCSSSTSWTRTS